VSLTTEQRSRLRVLADKYAQALVAAKLADRELEEKRLEFLDYIASLADEREP
jgi:hypothetical protein